LEKGCEVKPQQTRRKKESLQWLLPCMRRHGKAAAKFQHIIFKIKLYDILHQTISNLLSFSKISNAKKKTNKNRKNHDVHKTYIFYTLLRVLFIWNIIFSSFFQSSLYKNDKGPSWNPLFTISYKVHIFLTKISFLILIHSQILFNHL
jgi:hypothetical protein